MERFNVTLKQKSFEAKASNLGANDLEDLTRSIAKFCKKTVDLHVNLKNQKVLNQKSRIKVGQEMNISIEYSGEDFSLTVSLRNFGRFVMNNDEASIQSVIYSIAEYQEQVGYLFKVS